jgi:hypothetical protein
MSIVCVVCVVLYLHQHVIGLGLDHLGPRQRCRLLPDLCRVVAVDMRLEELVAVGHGRDQRHYGVSQGRKRGLDREEEVSVVCGECSVW